MHHSARYRSLLGAATAALVALSLAAPAARADDRHDHDRGRDHHFRDHRPHYYVPAPAPIYAPPPVYSPPVVETPGINLIFPLHFR
ncbi:MAG TPA: hypothetical protein VLX85_12040 [Stellaceae bacterium]|nr:hypothetical protein [Stellaceae bacterium]